MAKSLGIFVTSDSHLDELIKLCMAAKKKGIEVNIFFSHLGTQLTQAPRFAELEGLCKLTQARNAELIDDCDRYVVF
jgi:hypothetical protein